MLNHINTLKSEGWLCVSHSGDDPRDITPETSGGSYFPLRMPNFPRLSTDVMYHLPLLTPASTREKPVSMADLLIEHRCVCNSLSTHVMNVTNHNFQLVFSVAMLAIFCIHLLSLHLVQNLTLI